MGWREMMRSLFVRGQGQDSVETSTLIAKDSSEATLGTQPEDYQSVIVDIEQEEEGWRADREEEKQVNRWLALPLALLAAATVAWLLCALSRTVVISHPLLARTNTKTTDGGPSHKTLVPLQWDEHFVGHIEFCQGNDHDNKVYGYRLPGETSCGPAGLLIRLQPGHSYTLILHNTATVTTNIHTHGLHVSGSGNADDVTRLVEPGQCLLYDWTIPHNSMGGTYWLHAHPQGTSLEQLQGGAFAMLIVEDSPTLLDQIEHHQPQHLAPIQQWLRNELLLVAYTTKGVDNKAYVGPNDSPQPQLHLQEDTWYRLRVLTVDPKGRRVPLQFPAECQVHLAATDGVWLSETPSPIPQHEYTPTAAGRIDLAISCPQGHYPILVHQEPLATLQVAAATTISTANPFLDQQQSWRPTFPAHLQDLTTLADDTVVLERHTLTLTNRTINGHSWDPEVPLFSVEYNSYQEWNVQGTQNHPFHLHVFQVQTFDCPPYHIDGQYYDTIQSDSDDCRIRFHATDFTQRVVIHCHNVKHEDQGMMVWINVTTTTTTTNDGDDGPIQPTLYREEMSCSNPVITTKTSVANPLFP